MKLARFCLSAALLSVVVASDASAMPMAAGAAPLRPAPTLVRNGYGPLRNGLYGHHRHYHHRTRGSRTGGPSGGVPGRS